jgi:probable HAF family extracellular repeat protein
MQTISLAAIRCFLMVLVPTLMLQAQAPHYSVTDLGTLGGATDYGYGLNSSGIVVGNSKIAGDQYPDHAFVYNGTMQDLGTLT